MNRRTVEHECEYCNGSGCHGGYPCGNCGGKGLVRYELNDVDWREVWK